MRYPISLNGCGLAEIHFGMTQDEVAMVLGKPEDRSSYDDVIELYFPNFLNVLFRDDTAFQMGATKSAWDNVRWG